MLRGESNMIPTSRRHRALILACLFLIQAVIRAADDPSKPLEWWQVGAGIIALPAGILGLLFSYYQIQKTRLESRKLELELQEKERELRIKRPKAAIAENARKRAIYCSLSPSCHSLHRRIHSYLFLDFSTSYYAERLRFSFCHSFSRASGAANISNSYTASPSSDNYC